MIVYSDSYLDHHMEGHPEKRERLISILSLLREKNVFEKVSLREPNKAREKDILRVHSRAHLENMRKISKTSPHIEGDTYYTPETFETSLLAAGGVLTCIDENTNRGFALVRPPGHHATTNASMGFCIFNNVAVGAAYSRSIGYKKVAILDFDLHHGNGTQEIFYAQDILYISLHQWPHYPGTGSIEEMGTGDGEGFNINLPLPAGVGDKSYGYALNALVYPVLEKFSPDIMLVSAGYDAHYQDPLGGLLLTANAYKEISEKLKALATKIVFSLEGGYNLSALPKCVHSSIKGLFDLDHSSVEHEVEENENISTKVEDRVQALKKLALDYWDF
jgi:acetoin utilization deacetylase AcuC-like enzyme